MQQQYQDFDDVNFQYNDLQYKTEQENLMLLFYLGVPVVTVGTVYYFRDSIKSFFVSETAETPEQKTAREKAEAEAEKQHKAKIAEYVTKAKAKPEHKGKNDAELYQHILDHPDYDTNGPLGIIMKQMLKDIEDGKKKDQAQDKRMDDLNKGNGSAAVHQNIEELLYSNPNFNADLLLMYNVEKEMNSRDAILRVEANKKALDTLIDFINIPSAQITSANSNDLSSALVTLQKALLSNFPFNPTSHISLANAFTKLKKTGKGSLTYSDIEEAIVLLGDSSLVSDPKRADIKNTTEGVNKVLEIFDKDDRSDDKNKIDAFKKIYANADIKRVFTEKVAQDIKDKTLETAKGKELKAPTDENYFDKTKTLGDDTIAALSDPHKKELSDYRNLLLSMTVSDWKKIIAKDLETNAKDNITKILETMSATLKNESKNLLDQLMNLTSNRQKNLESTVGKSLGRFETSRMSMLKESARMLSSALFLKTGAELSDIELNGFSTSFKDIKSIFSNIKNLCVEEKAKNLETAFTAVETDPRYTRAAGKHDDAANKALVTALTELNKEITNLNAKQ